jgi:hypothetical protein
MPRKRKSYSASPSKSTFKSPYASSFKTGIKSGTPCSTVVENIAKRTGKPITSIVNSLRKAGWCYCQKFNGTWIYWPAFPCKSGATTTCQINMWQSFIDWCVAGGFCKPKQLQKKISSQKNFMAFCRHFFAKQFSGITTKSKRRSRRSTKSRTTSRRPRTSWARHTSYRTYRFPSYSLRNGSRRYVRAA